MNLKSDDFEFCEEATIKTIKMGYKIKEIPISYNPRKFSAGKKIRIIDGVSAIWSIIRYKTHKE